VPGAISPRAAIAAANLHVDAVAVEAIEAMRAVGLDPILFKGPDTANWLGEESVRAYQDCDLLVDPADEDRAGAVLERLGYNPYMEGADLGERWTHPARLWRRGADQVDLHHSLFGAESDPAEVWVQLSDRTTALRRGRTELTVLDRTATALVLALHAAQHGRAVAQPLDHLRLALARIERTSWEEAAGVAVSIGATAAFAAGLRLVPEGEALAHELALPDAPPVTVALAAASAPPQALALEQLTSQPGLRAKAAYVGRRLVPSAPWMRVSYPIARRGPVGLAAAHVWRLASAPVRIGRAVPAWRRARRRAAA